MRDAQTKKLITLAIFARPSLEEPTEIVRLIVIFKFLKSLPGCLGCLHGKSLVFKFKVGWIAPAHLTVFELVEVSDNHQAVAGCWLVDGVLVRVELNSG